LRCKQHKEEKRKEIEEKEKRKWSEKKVTKTMGQVILSPKENALLLNSKKSVK